MNPINYAFGKTKAPCKDCSDRKVGCHSVCEKYLEWKRVHDQEVEVVKNEKNMEAMNVERIKRITGVVYKEK